MTDCQTQIVRCIDRLAVPLCNHIARHYSGLVGRRAGNDLRNQYSVGALQAQPFGQIDVQGIQPGSQPPPRHGAFFDQMLRDLLGNTAGDGKAYAAIGLSYNGRVDTHDLALHVHQRPAAIAGVHGRVGLQKVLFNEPPDVDFAALGADYARGHRTHQPEGIADRDDRIADFQIVTIAPLGHGQIGGVDLQNGQIAGRVYSHNLNVFDLPPIAEPHNNRIGAFDYVEIGHYVARSAHNHARRLALQGHLSKSERPSTDRHKNGSCADGLDAHNRRGDTPGNPGDNALGVGQFGQQLLGVFCVGLLRISKSLDFRPLAAPRGGIPNSLGEIRKRYQNNQHGKDHYQSITPPWRSYAFGQTRGGSRRIGR